MIAEKTVDTQRAQVLQFDAQTKAEDANIANLRAVLAYTTVIAPIDGRTGIRMVDEGNLARASDAGIVVINEIRPIVVQFTVPQQQLASINAALVKGTVAAEALDADGRTVIDRGTVQVVDNLVDPATGTVKIKAEFPNATLQLWPGQFANARILVETLSQVVVVPTPAVQRGPSGTVAYVIGADSKVALKPITVRQQTDTEAVVASGLAAGDRVVTTGFARLNDGSRVIIGTPGEARPALPAGAGKGEGKGEWKGARKDGGTPPAPPDAATATGAATAAPSAPPSAAVQTAPTGPEATERRGKRGAAGHTAQTPEAKTDAPATR